MFSRPHKILAKTRNILNDPVDDLIFGEMMWQGKETSLKYSNVCLEFFANAPTRSKLKRFSLCYLCRIKKKR